MAAIVWTKVPDSEDVWGRKRVAIWTMTLNATAYVAGGFAVTGATFGLKGILGMDNISQGPPSTTTSYMPAYNSATGSIQIFTTPGTVSLPFQEVVSGSLTLSWTWLVISTSD